MPRQVESGHFVGQKVEKRFPVDFEPKAELIGKIERFNIKNMIAQDYPYMIYATPS